MLHSLTLVQMIESNSVLYEWMSGTSCWLQMKLVILHLAGVAVLKETRQTWNDMAAADNVTFYAFINRLLT